MGFVGFIPEMFDIYDHVIKCDCCLCSLRYDELWMPLISDLTVGLKPPMILPPLDVEWVWFCHTLNPVSSESILYYTKILI